MKHISGALDVTRFTEDHYAEECPVCGTVLTEVDGELVCKTCEGK